MVNGFTFCSISILNGNPKWFSNGLIFLNFDDKIRLFGRTNTSLIVVSNLLYVKVESIFFIKFLLIFLFARSSVKRFAYKIS